MTKYKQRIEILNSIISLKNDDGTTFYNIDWVLEKIMKFDKNDIYNFKKEKQMKLRIKKLERILRKNNK